MSVKQKTDSTVQISKTMSWVLRHGLNELNLTPDELGRIPLNTLLNLNQMKEVGATKSLVVNIVNSSDKQRFRLETVNRVEMIGANQGHSKDIGNKINNDKLMERITKPFDLCVHGTYSNIIDEIKKTGLKTMNRTHVHFATGYPDNKKVISGARSNTNAFIELDMEKAMGDGMIFYLSSNGVILTDGLGGIIDPKYFKNIVLK